MSNTPQTSVRTLRDYRPQHDEDCAAVAYCPRCRYRKNQMGHIETHCIEPTPPCSCGLDALLAADAEASVSIEQAKELTFDQFSAVNRERCESPNGFNHLLTSWSVSDWFTAVIGEFGEAANVAKKLNRVRDGIPGNKETETQLREKLRRELGDAFVYLDLLAQALGFNIGAAAVDVFNAKSDEIGCPIKIAAVRAEAAQEIERLKREVADGYLAYKAQRERAEAAEARLTHADQRERDALRARAAVEQVAKNCPCGFRPETPKTHPHAIGCPVAAALAYLESEN